MIIIPLVVSLAKDNLMILVWPLNYLMVKGQSQVNTRKKQLAYLPFTAASALSRLL